MANAWFRMYAEFATDPKVQMLSESMQRRFMMLLCLRCSNGDVTLQDDEVAFQLRISNEEWADTKALLIAKGLIDLSAKPCAWAKRQYASDSSAARVSAHREKKKQACNVTVTPPDTDTDTDTDKNTAPAKPSRKSPKTTLPEGFALSDRVKTWAAGEGYSGNRVAENFATFVLSAQSKGYAYSDWDAALMNAIRKDWAGVGSAPLPADPTSPNGLYRYAVPMGAAQ